MDSDPLPTIWNFTLVLFLVLMNGFFVAAEFAMVKVRSSRIDALVQEGNRRARFAQTVVANLNGYLSACQLGITLASLALGWIGEPAIARLLEPVLHPLQLSSAVIHTISFIIAFTIITAFHITLGEQFPKTYAIRMSEKVTLLSAGPLIVFYKLMYPLIWTLNGTSNWMLRKAGIEPEEEHHTAHTEEEIRVLMKESNKSGLIDNTELALVDNIFDFTETNAREIMIPRTEMVCLYANRSYEENRLIAVTEMHTRYPVCNPDKDNIIGFIHIKDLLKSDPGMEHIKSIVRPITKVPESMQISALLKLMQKKRNQMVLLIDEYGGTSGLVTFEDIIEEIVGEIQDEFDEERPRIEKKDHLTHSIDGRMLIEEVNSYFGLEIESDDYDTIGGWVYSQVEMPPKKNQRIRYDDTTDFIIAETDQLRIARIVVKQKPNGAQPGNSSFSI
ncbi:hemolysin family protein [Paenibacillus doosanensis]|uniref:Magnesium and cobalt efflux protein CorC n=1 Tax=Paenibacillus konkukensis TaxID=2020716 RepID=A0ABY4RLK3_9BACL|nr:MULTISPECIES: hemolysin family protein [Paenibacillus]MCS7462630.1 hemolysin family protein [Paenibacillus doosanensis]UQZ82549.1 Magnesium and cobalt efflux protein CorC [Paenibacillus konkukensis]